MHASVSLVPPALCVQSRDLLMTQRPSVRSLASRIKVIQRGCPRMSTSEHVRLLLSLGPFQSVSLTARQWMRHVDQACRPVQLSNCVSSNCVLVSLGLGSSIHPTCVNMRAAAPVTRQLVCSFLRPALAPQAQAYACQPALPRAACRVFPKMYQSSRASFAVSAESRAVDPALS